MKVVEELKSKIIPETMFTLMDAANFVGHKYDLADDVICTLCQQMMDAVGKGLIVRDPKTKLPFIPKVKVRWYFEQVKADDLDQWFESKNVEYRIQHPATNNSEVLKSEPVRVRVGITKQYVINAFESVYWSRDQWGKYLATTPKWLQPCRMTKGNKTTSATWNPTSIGLALLDKKIKLKQLDLVFMGLKDWKDEWQEKTDLMR